MKLRILLPPAFLLLGCASFGEDFTLITVGEEWELGEALARDLEGGIRLIEDPEVAAYAAALGETLLAQARGDHPAVAARPWTFRVVDDPSIHAFTLPGGRVYLHAGLVERAEAYPEILAAVAHQVAHGLLRHGAENLTRRFGISLLTEMLSGREPAVYRTVLEEAAAGGPLFRFDEDAEREADRLGIAYVYRAGVDPLGTVFLLRRLEDLDPASSGLLERFVAAHPLTRDRIEDVRKHVRSLPPKELRTEDPGLAAFREAVLRAAS